jgi:hypothetical protein
MPKRHHAGRVGGLGVVLAAGFLGCASPLLPRDYFNGSRVSSPEYVNGPAPLRMPSPDRIATADHETFEDGLTGGQVFQMYCSQCHNRRPMSERPFANYRNVAAHMRTRANLSGKEYDKLVAWMRQVQDAPLPNPDTEPSPKRFVFSQPISELRAAQEALPGAAGPVALPPAAGPAQ